MKILFLGDIVGKIGRRAVTKVLPDWREEHKPDIIIANGENIAHGKGFTKDTLDEAIQAGVDIFTSGNHVAKKNEGLSLLSDKNIPMIRPANYPPQVPGDGYRIIEVGTTKIAVINLIGRHFIKEKFDCPFRVFDEIIKELPKQVKIIFVDFHAEATSEKVAFSFHAHGRASAIVGTHTHIQTSDEHILPNGTAYITDAGMAGAVDSIIGVEKDNIIAEFLDQLPRKHEIPETGEAKVNAVLIEIDKKSGKAESIERLEEFISI